MKEKIIKELNLIEKEKYYVYSIQVPVEKSRDFKRNTLDALQDVIRMVANDMYKVGILGE